MSGRTFHAVLLAVSDELASGDLGRLKHLCHDAVGKKALERVDSGFALFQLLTERGELGPEKTQFLAERLHDIGRKDLAERLCGDAGDGVERPDPKETAKLDAAAVFLSKNLGRSWRKLGRHLGLSEVKLDSIGTKNPWDLEEAAMALVLEWRQIRGGGARAADLVEALRACELNLTADKLEDKLAP